MYAQMYTMNAVDALYCTPMNAMIWRTPYCKSMNSIDTFVIRGRGNADAVGLSNRGVTPKNWIAVTVNDKQDDEFKPFRGKNYHFRRSFVSGLLIYCL